MPKTIKRGGRKPFPPEKVRAKSLPLRLTTPERKMVDDAAEMDHDKAINWGRRMVVTVAEWRVQGVTVGEAYAAAQTLRSATRK